jgi:hypothetical protein
MLDDALDKINILEEEFRKAAQKDEESANKFWDSLSYDDKCNAFHAVISKIVKGDMKDNGSYRYVLYDVFGFGPDMYTRGMECGYMALHNAIVTDYNKDSDK